VADTPSTRAIFLSGGKQLLGFTIAWLILEAVWWHGRYGISWPIEVGGMLAIIEMARLYWRPEWRSAVAPEHMLGIGFCSAAFVAMSFMSLPDEAPKLGWLRIVAVALLLMPPVFLMVLAAREMFMVGRGVQSDGK
jgi:hypothetical protein